MPSWRDNLRPGSFRGVSFFCRDVSNDAGQRLAAFEFPDSDTPYVQALGRGIKEYRLEIYVAGDDYMAQRRALEAALDADGAGTLVHPYRGPLQVYARHPCRIREEANAGRAAFFDAVFLEASGPAPPVPSASTPDTAQSAVTAAQPQINAAYAPQYDGESETVQTAFAVALAAVQTALSGALTAPAATLQLVEDLAGLAGLAPDDAIGYAAQLAVVLAGYVTNVVAAAAPAPDPSLAPGYQDWSRLPALPGDPSYGVAALAATSLVPAAATGTIASNWATLSQLVQGSATAALVLLYAQTSFDSSADADAAREQIFGLVVGQIELSAGNDALAQAWRGVMTAAVTDITARAAAAPDIATLETQTPLPALALAQQLYRDGSQAAALVQRNGAPHPLFMPLAVEYLQQ